MGAGQEVMDDADGKGSKKVVGSKIPIGTKTAGFSDLGSKKVVMASGGKAPIIPESAVSDNTRRKDKDKDKAGGKDKDKDKDKAGKSNKEKDKDKDKDKLKKGKKTQKWGKADGKHTTRSARAGVQFPVGRVHRYLKKYVSA